MRTLIIGFGIAGSMMAWAMHKRGRDFLIVDRGDKRTASMTAAGVLNPVTGKRLVKTWQADTALPIAKQTYRAIEKELGQSFLRESPVLRLCKDEREQKQWQKRKRNPAYQAYLGDPIQPGAHHPALLDDFGIFPILQAAVLDLENFLPAMRSFFETKKQFREAEFSFQDLEVKKDCVAWQGENFERVLFCQGWTSTENPFFPDLPYEPAKGEILHLKTPGLTLPPQILNRQKWILPYQDNSLKIGSTWGWERLDNDPTSQGEAALLQGLQRMLRLDTKPTVIDRRAGVRPCTKDRRPFIGTSTASHRLHLFNGFGSKGTFYTPWLADNLLAHIYDGQTLTPEADVRRLAPA